MTGALAGWIGRLQTALYEGAVQPVVYALDLVEFAEPAYEATEWSFGRVGEWLLVSPRFHRLHHAIGGGHEGRYRGCNFAVLFPLWDLVFRTADFGDRFQPTGVCDQLTGRDYGEGFWAQQWLGQAASAQAGIVQTTRDAVEIVALIADVTDARAGAEISPGGGPHRPLPGRGGEGGHEASDRGHQPCRGTSSTASKAPLF